MTKVEKEVAFVTLGALLGVYSANLITEARKILYPISNATEFLLTDSILVTIMAAAILIIAKYF